VSLTTSRRKATVNVSQTRWIAYATAGAASAVLGINSAEATIQYSGVINEVFSTGGHHEDLFFLGNAFISLSYTRSFHGPHDVAHFQIGAALDASFNGFVANGHSYISKLASGVNPATRPFAGFNAFIAYGNGRGPNSQWLDPGTGFIGFRFDSGNGFQYGWMRLTMDGAPGNSFTLVDYAWGDLGDSILTGQIPEPGSLALLAVGAAGLLAWRRHRASVGNHHHGGRAFPAAQS
jgi:hypothetical protein